MSTAPVTLEGTLVSLVPLERSHASALASVGMDSRLWEWTPRRITTEEDMVHYVEEAVEEREAGIALPFAIIEKGTNRPVGSTRFGNINPGHRRAEIGWTWVAPPWQRTGVNTEAKYLMLRHAFESMGCLRVEFKTDALNLRSREAILRLGAKEEGILRRHMVTASGRVRDTVYYSILQEEWPVVRERLERYLSGGGRGAGSAALRNPSV